MRLLAKFTLIYVLVFGAGLGAAAYIFYGVLQRNAREQVLYNAKLMMETALATRSYTNEQVKPAIMSTMEHLLASEQKGAQDDVFRDLCAKKGFVGKRVFHPETVPAYAATQVFAQLRKNYPDYFYKEAALNPTNPRNRALDWEEDLIKEFKNRPDVKVLDGERDTPLGKSLFLAQPMRPAKACLQCHSTPDSAPPEMLAKYGPANGFGWSENDVIAAQIVSVPVSLPVGMANRAFRQIIVSLAIVGIVTLIVMNALLYVAVVRPLSQFAVRADEISRGQLDVPELAVRGRDEISVLAAAFNRMHRSVSAAMKMLEGDAEPEPPPPEDEDDDRG